MSKLFSRRSFLKRSAAFIGAVALALTMIGCSGSSKITLNGYVDNEDDLDISLSGPTISNADTTKWYDVGNGIKINGAIGVGYARHRKLKDEGYYPAVTLLLHNTSSSQTVTISPSQFSDIYFDGKRANGVRGFKLVADGFAQSIELPANKVTAVKVFLNAPSQTTLELNGQSISFAFSINSAKKVRCSGTFSDKPIFTINY